MKRFIEIFVVLFLTVTLLGTVSKCSAYEVPEGKITIAYENRENILDKKEKCDKNQEAAAKMAEAARQLGYPEDHEVIQLAGKEWTKNHNLSEQYQEQYNSIVKQHKSIKEKQQKEYRAASYIWDYLKDAGYNNYVVAGILGNIMTECGGQTLNIQYKVDTNKNHYGMCQWSKGYAEVWGRGLSGQCEFLVSTIEYELNTYGKKYRKNFNYQQFVNMRDEREAAKAFAKCYERCGLGSYGKRMNNAQFAYSYFVF